MRTEQGPQIDQRHDLPRSRIAVRGPALTLAPPRGTRPAASLLPSKAGDGAHAVPAPPLVRFVAGAHVDGQATGERGLMLAVLADAIQCLAGATGPVRHRARVAADARAWVAECSATWPFSFERICEALDLDRSRLRTRLLADAPEVPEVDPPRKRRRLPAPEDVGRMITEGQPLRAIARAFGISTSKVSVLSGGLASRMKASRDDEIWRLRALGWTHSALAERFGLSRIRVLRICARGCTARAAVVAFADHVAPDRTGTAE